MTAKTIFRNEDGHLFRHLRYTYNYDSENRVTSKEAFKWDSVKEACRSVFSSKGEILHFSVSLTNRERSSHKLNHSIMPVSYTHLDVYKRQHPEFLRKQGRVHTGDAFPGTGPGQKTLRQ